MIDRNERTRNSRARTATAVAVLALAVAGLGAIPANASPTGSGTPAAARGNCTDIMPGPGHLHLCGNVTNHGSRPVKISTDWGSNQPGRHTATLRPGQDGPDIHVRDVDGYYVPGGCTYKILGLRSVKGPVWVKVFDGQNVQITSTNC